MGQLGILNVGAGDTKLVFDKDNLQDCIRAARIVKDMLRRGYALIIEVEKDGVKTYERVRDFREDTFEYIIADIDPDVAEKIASEVDVETIVEASAPQKRGRSKIKTIKATETTGVAVSRTAGG